MIEISVDQAIAAITSTAALFTLLGVVVGVTMDRNPKL